MVTSQQSVLPNNRTTDGRTKDVKVPTKDAKLGDDWKKGQDRPQFSNKTNKCLNCAGDHRTQDCPTRHQPHAPPLATPLMVQEFTEIVHNLKIILPNNTPNKVHPQ